MHPEGKTPAEAATRYAEIVAEVKSKYAKKPAKSFAGEEVTEEIRKRWAKECGVKFEPAEPPVPMPEPSGERLSTVNQADGSKELTRPKSAAAKL